MDLYTNISQIQVHFSSLLSNCKRLPSHTGQEQACSRITWLVVWALFGQKEALETHPAPFLLNKLREVHWTKKEYEGHNP